MHRTKYVCDTLSGRIRKLPVTEFIAPSDFGNVVLRSPQYITGTADIVYVIDKFKCVVMFDAEGEHLGSVGGEAMFDTPTGIAVSPEGTVYVCDHARGTIISF